MELSYEVNLPDSRTYAELSEKFGQLAKAKGVVRDGIYGLGVEGRTSFGGGVCARPNSPTL